MVCTIEAWSGMQRAGCGEGLFKPRGSRVRRWSAAVVLESCRLEEVSGWQIR